MTTTPDGDRVGDILVSLGACTRADVERVMAEQRCDGGDVGSLLIDHRLVTPAQLARALEIQREMRASPSRAVRAYLRLTRERSERVLTACVAGVR